MNPNLLLAIPLLRLRQPSWRAFRQGDRPCGSHSVTIAGVAISTALSMYVLSRCISTACLRTTRPSTPGCVSDGITSASGSSSSPHRAHDDCVRCVALRARLHIGYLRKPGYQRSSATLLFTFSMLMLVMANTSAAFFGLESGGRGVLPAHRFLYTRHRDLRET